MSKSDFDLSVLGTVHCLHRSVSFLLSSFIFASSLQGEVWGAAYELEGKTMVQEALHHLNVRECARDGYIAGWVRFKSRTSTGDEGPSPYTRVLVFQATPTNDQYLGPASIDDMANQIIACNGESGSNVEYVTKLADYVRTYIPEDRDPHLLELDSSIRALLGQ